MIDDVYEKLKPFLNEAHCEVIVKSILKKGIQLSNTQRTNDAIEVVEQFGCVDGDSHKKWVIDQMVRKLLGEQYNEWRESWIEEDGEYYDSYEEGTPP